METHDDKGKQAMAYKQSVAEPTNSLLLAVVEKR